MKTFWNDIFNDSTPLPLSFEYRLYTQKAQRLLFVFHFCFFLNERRKKLRGLVYKNHFSLSAILSPWFQLFLPIQLTFIDYLLLPNYKCYSKKKKIICKYNIKKKKTKRTVNQSPVSFLDFTIYWIRKIFLREFLIPDTLLSALIKPNTKY